MSTVYNSEYCGKVRISSVHLGNPQWKTGSFKIIPTEKGWKIVFRLKVNPNKTYYESVLSEQTVKRVSTKKRLVIDIFDGAMLQVMELSNKDLDEIGDLLTSIKGGFMLPSHGKQQSGFGLRTTPVKPIKGGAPTTSTPMARRPMTPATPKQTKSMLDNPSSSSHHFTGVKDASSKKDKITLFEDGADDQFEVEKENLGSKNGTRDGTNRRFLDSAASKSKEALSNLQTSTFYGNQNQTPAQRTYGTLGFHGSSLKRRPGFLTDPSDRKRSRLAMPSVSFTWKNKVSPVVTPDRKFALQGFSNLGNTCYMNAILQSLFGLETFASDLLILHQKLQRQAIGTTHINGLLHSMSRLLIHKHKGTTDIETRRQLLSNVKRNISSSAKRFCGFEQHDAHEFLSQVLDQLKEEVIKHEKGDREPSPSKADQDTSQSEKAPSDGEEASPKSDKSSHSPVAKPTVPNPTSQNFEFNVLHTISCLSCGEEVTKEEEFHDLSMDMPRNKGEDGPGCIQDSLDQFFLKEKLEYVCEKCQANQADVSHTFTRLPRVLVLHLKRYYFQLSRTEYGKAGQSVHIPKFLTLRAHCNEETSPPPPAVLHNPASIYTSARRFSFKGSSGQARDSTEHHIRADNTAEDQLIQAMTDSRHDTIERKQVVDEEEENLRKAMELSLKENKEEDSPQETPANESSEFNVADLTEEEQLKLVLEKSMLETHAPALSPSASPLFDSPYCDTLYSEGSDSGTPNCLQMDSIAVPVEGQVDGASMEEGEIADDESDTLMTPAYPNLCSGSNQLAVPPRRTRHNLNSQSKTPCYRLPLSSQLDGAHSDDTQDESGDSDSHTENTGSDSKTKHSNGIEKVDENEHSGGNDIENGHDSDYESIKKTKMDRDLLYYFKPTQSLSHSKSGKRHHKKITRIPATSTKACRDILDDLEPSSAPDEHQEEMCRGGAEDPQDGLSNPTKQLFINVDPEVGIKSPNPTIEVTAHSSGEESPFLLVPDSDTPETRQQSPSGQRKRKKCNLDALEEEYMKDEGIDLLCEGQRSNDLPDLDDNKENQTPAEGSTATGAESDPDWLKSQRAEKEDDDLQKALAMSIMDQDMTTEKEYEEQIRAAMEESLKEFSQQLGTGLEPLGPEEQEVGVELRRTPEEEQELRQNSEKGHLPYSYQLMSVVSHLGSSSSLGHYICDVNDLKKKKVPTATLR